MLVYDIFISLERTITKHGTWHWNLTIVKLFFGFIERFVLLS